MNHSNTIYHVLSRCGGGKTYHSLNDLLGLCVGKQQANEQHDRVIFFASKTNDLTKQSYSDFMQLCENNNVTGLPVKKIDSDTHSRVVETITNLVKNNQFKGVLFVSHKVLTQLPECVLENALIATDEVPQELVEHINIQYKDNTMASLDTWVTVGEDVGEGFKEVKLKEDVKEKAAELLEDIHSKRNNMLSEDTANILSFLLEGYSVLYKRTSNKEDGSVSHIYQALHYSPLMKVVSNAYKFIVLSAQFKQTLFGYIAVNLLGLEVKEIDRLINTPLETKHKHKVVIVPFLKTGNWSKSLKDKPISEGISSAVSLDGDITVREFIQQFADDILGSKYLLFKNKDDAVIPQVNRTDVEPLKTAVHGLNCYSSFTKAVFIASLIPSPIEKGMVRKFAEDNDGLSRKEIYDAMVTERCYEAAYQCVARTAIRKPTADIKPDDEVCVFVVPDMGYANYIARWFEDGCCTIDTSKSYIAKSIEDAKQRKIDSANARLEVVINILMDKKKKIDTMKNILASYGIGKTTFHKYKIEHKARLQQLELMR